MEIFEWKQTNVGNAGEEVEFVGFDMFWLKLVALSELSRAFLSERKSLFATALYPKSQLYR